jgi:zinc protease
MTDKPLAGKIITEKKDEAIGVTELTLSNGIKVALKPTDFKNDEIKFEAFSPGGTSLYNDVDYHSATRAASLVNYGGIADFSATQLEKYLSGKKMEVSPFINERFEGITGSSTLKDFETALQLTHLYFTNPRKDVEVYKGVLSQEKAMLATRNNDPAAVFSDTVSAVLGNYNIRRTGPSIEKLNKVNLDRAFEIYKERFADAGDFTFTFVGNFDVEKIKPLLELYLGSLPTIQRLEAARDLGIEEPAGKIQKEVFKGQEPKVGVRLIFSGNYQFVKDENDKLDAIAEVLNIKLIERLREKESGVYGVGARVSYSKYPQNRYMLFVSFGCAPENVEKLINSTLDEIRKVRENGPLQIDIDKLTAEKLRYTELQLKNNEFWLTYLTYQYQNNENSGQILSYQDDLRKITPDALKLAAAKYLSGDNFIRLVLYPDKK